MTENREADALDGTAARNIARACLHGALATIDAAEGGPYVSMVTLACDHDGAPVLLLSDLADHSRNLANDDRVSLLVEAVPAGARPPANPQTRARATLIGRIAESTDPRHRARYLARHPDARAYAGFADFRVYRFAVARVRLVGGFAKAVTLPGTGYPFSGEWRALADTEETILDHMNAHHADALDDMARHLARRDGSGWTMTGVDPEGADLRRGGVAARLPFDGPIADADDARRVLVDLAARARAAA
ncbi:MAG: HugZ family pyridoxamine 5'-phosphate oxidase [Alphaproteobacteria bacterium]